MATDTKTKIALAALRLFNRLGTGRVSTNTIAAAAGISPGNLYYHFRDKEEIIRLLFERMNAEADEIWQAAAVAPQLPAMLAAHLKLYGKYRFMARELPGLSHTD